MSFQGYDSSHNEWLPDSHLANAPHTLTAYQALHGLALDLAVWGEYCNGLYRGICQYMLLREPGPYLYYTASAMPVAVQRYNQIMCITPWVTSIMLYSFPIRLGLLVL